MHDIACASSVASAISCFLLPDSGGCARKRAAMSVTLTSVKRVQSSPNLLAAGITPLTHRIMPEWLHLTSLFPESSWWDGNRQLKCLPSPSLNFIFFSNSKNSFYPFWFYSKNKKSQRKLIPC